MTDQLQFSCPACGKTLVLPAAAAGAQGPCPLCAEEIIGPDPSSGQQAQRVEMEAPWAEQMAPMPPAPKTQAAEPEPEPLEPEPEPLQAEPEPPEAEPRPAEPEPRPLTDSPLDDPLAQLDQAGSTTAPPAVRKGISPAALIFSWLLIGALAFAGGFLTGKKYAAGTTPADPPSGNPAATPPGAAVPLKTWLPPNGEPTQPPTGDAATAGPASVLRAFLSAPGWAARSAHVLNSDNVHQSMAVQASIYGDGPIEATEISLLQKGEHSHVFLVKTAKIPAGFPVALARTGDGWLVDWETFSEFHYDRFKLFAAEPSEDHQTFHLLVNRSSPGADKEIATFRLNPPMPGREKPAKVRKDSTAYATLTEVFKQQQELDPETFRELTKTQGLPLVVVLSSRGNGSGETTLWIDDVVAVGWGPQPAE